MKLLLLAGEESGVLYANGIAERARKAYPDVEIRGYGDYGFETHDLAVMGFFAVVRKLFFFLRVKKTLERAIDEWRPDVVCTVDYPGMNLKLAAYAKARGIRAVHVVCPQVWAWKAGRIPKIEAALDHLCCFFPFEPKLFKPGFAEFIGHPLVAAMKEQGIGTGEQGMGNGKLTLAVLPGSRMGEIDKHMPILQEVIRGLREKIPELEVVIPAANDRAYARIQAFNVRPAAFNLIRGGARELLQRADCAVVASGTATLEAALARCPTVLVYKVNCLFATFLRFAFRGMIRHVGLANIIWEKCVESSSKDAALSEAPMPELLQRDFSVAGVRMYLEAWLGNAEARREARCRLNATMVFLEGEGDPLSRVVSAFESYESIIQNYDKQ